MDVARARRETPGCDGGMIHFNNAGASLQPRCVLAAVKGHLDLEAQLGGYRALDQAADRVEAVYASAARLLNCAPDEIALTESATRSWDAAFAALPLTPGDRILTAKAEYASNVIAMLQAERRGVAVDLAPDDEHGQVDVDALAALVGPRTRLIALTHAPTDSGLVNPAAAVGRVAQAAGVPFLLDACQTAGQMPLDVAALGCTMLSFTGRKYLRGPRGTGVLYVRRDWIERMEPATLDLRAATWSGPGNYAIRPDARRFETWEAAHANRLGLGAALDDALGWGLEAIRARIDHLAQSLRARLGQLPGVTVHDRGLVQSGLVTFSRDGEAPADAQRSLQAQDINVSVTAPGYARFDGAVPRIRASVHHFNTEAEIDRFITALEAP